MPFKIIQKNDSDDGTKGDHNIEQNKATSTKKHHEKSIMTLKIQNNWHINSAFPEVPFSNAREMSPN